ncbi:MAG TPA: ECF-type sigma factor, partial [Planctomycetaceae bacterium]|nr:ECF-type sigma factor [Planctomycetaceae bacterium]
MNEKHNVTQILQNAERGDPTTAEALLPLVYGELRRLAAEQLASEQPGQTLQATALVHEAWLRLVDVNYVQNWSSRRHFFGAAAEAMRRILVDQARRRKRNKHGGDFRQITIPLEEVSAVRAGGWLGAAAGYAGGEFLRVSARRPVDAFIFAGARPVGDALALGEFKGKSFRLPLAAGLLSLCVAKEKVTKEKGHPASAPCGHPVRKV